MKKNILFTLFVFLLLSPSLKAQTTDVKLNDFSYFGPGGNYFCGVPQTIYFDIWGTCNSYNVSDSMTLKVSFGDGKDTTFRCRIYGGIPQSFYGQAKHKYTGTGIFAVQCIAIAPDGKRDTLDIQDPIVIENPCQTHIRINNKDSLSFYNRCIIPQNIYFNVYGNAIAYTSSADSVTLEYSFGDGKDTTVKVPIYGQGDYYNFYTNVKHTYTSAGNYSVRIIATGIDGKADTVIKGNAVVLRDTCGNISGTIYQDSNKDCSYTNGEPLLQNIPVTLYENNQAIGYTSTNQSGFYSFTAPAGSNYVVKPHYTSPYYTSTFYYSYPSYKSICPPQYNVSTVPSAGRDFGMQCYDGFDVTGNVSGWGFRPGFTANLYLNAFNNRCEPVNGKVKLLLDPKLIYKNYSSQAPVQSGDTLIWSYSNLTNLNSGYWGSSGFWEIVETETDLSAAIGDTVCVTLIVEPITGDSVPSDNIRKFCFPVRNSWDPNMKEVHGDGLNAGRIRPNKKLVYTVHFQNTGNDTAYNVAIIDTLDNNLHSGSLHIIASSHAVSPQYLSDDVIKFSFNNIMLVDSITNEPGSKGFVTYEIEQSKDLPLGTMVHNTAHIYFDFNPAIVTNTASVMIDSTVISGVRENRENSAIVYPNPAKSTVKVRFAGSKQNRSLEIRDITGRLVLTEKAEAATNTFQVSTLPNGMYTLLIRDGNTIQRNKLIISR